MSTRTQRARLVRHTEGVSEPGEYREGAIDLLGFLAYGALSGFDRTADDAKLAPTLRDKVQLCALAVRRFEGFQSIQRRLADFRVDVMAAMAPFHNAFDAYHSRTAPRTWLEGLIKAYVGEGFAADFYREIAAFVDPETRALVHAVVANEGYDDYVIERVGEATSATPEIAGRLALWGRRLVGEALSQAQLVAAERDVLTSLLTGTEDRAGADLAAISRMFSRLVENHTERMGRLGLQA